MATPLFLTHLFIQHPVLFIRHLLYARLCGAFQGTVGNKTFVIHFKDSKDSALYTACALRKC